MATVTGLTAARMLQAELDFQNAQLGLSTVGVDDDGVPYFDAAGAGGIPQAATQEDLANVASNPALTAAYVGSAVGALTGSGADETAALAAILAAATNGQTLRFDRRKQITINGTSLLVIDNKHNLVIDGLNIVGTSANAFKIASGSSNITFRDCTFTDVGQVILLFTCSQITVENCLFDHTGYGVIQQLGYVSSFVTVTGCIARNMQADFIEANCATAAPSEGWTITGNRYLGSNGYPVVATEKRFVGITAVKNVVIANNIVRNCCGDAAIHLEDVGGQAIVTGNVIENCVGSHAYLYILHSAKDVIVDGNWFIQSDITLPVATVMDLGSGNYTCNVAFTNNHILGNPSRTLSGIATGSTAMASCTGNVFRQLDVVFNHSNNATGGAFNDNTVIDCNTGVKGRPAGASGGSGNLLRVEGNHFGCITFSIDIQRNSSGTGGAVGWTVIGNYFAADAIGTDTADFKVMGNVSAVGKVLALDGTFYTAASLRYVAAGNTVIGTTDSFALGSDASLGSRKGLRITEGTGATSGVATLIGGTVTIPNAYTVTATSRIQVSIQSLGTVTAPKAVGVTARVAGTSFTITSADATDTSTVAWFFIAPA